MGTIKLQSALEFLTTYSFMFIIIAIAIVLVVVLASSARTYVPTQCQGFGGFTCKSGIFTSNYVTGNSILVLTLANAQSVPVNVTSIKAVVDGKTSIGTCASQFVEPGMNSTCVIKYIGFTLPLGNSVSGTYTVNAQYCNSAIVNLTATSCTYSNVVYVGSFSTQTIPSSPVFAFGGDEFQSSLPLVPNFDLYLCSGFNDQGLITYSWTADATSAGFTYPNGTRYVGGSIGHQSAPDCTSTAAINNQSMAGVAILGTRTYTLLYRYARTQPIGATGFSNTYAIPAGQAYVIVILGCGGGLTCLSVNIPPGCVPEIKENIGLREPSASSEVILCRSPAAGNYNINGSMGGRAYFGMAVYGFA
ncbi:MAG: hypothetical protein KGH72_05005 [Candidatus Micrarchaeota archaeon]|nr:hypothetical protein [Candidatus Micrarchaeota archaeon]